MRPALIPQLEPKLVGWFAHAHPFDFQMPPIDYIPDIGRFQIGTLAISALHAAQPGLDLIAKIGADAIRAKSIHQTTRLLALADELGFPTTTPRKTNERGGTVAVNVENGYAISKILKDREFLVDFRPGAGIRISPHFYTSDDEVDAIMLEIKQIIESRAHEKYLVEARDTVT